MSELDNLGGGIVAVGVGAAVGTAVHPVMEPARQEAWKEVTDPKGGNTSRVLDIGALARLVAQAIVTLGDAEDQAHRQGFNRNKLGAAVQLALTAPDTATALNLWRRGYIDGAAVDHALSKAQIEPAYHAAILKLKAALLSPGEVAAAIHRGLIPDPGLLKGEQPSGPRNVESYPVYPIDALDTAAGHGFTKDQLGVLVGLQGLPMGVIEAAQAYFRKIITYGDYIAAFNESNNRNEWAASVLEYAKQIPTARDFFENALRGYHDLTWAQKQAERHGMSPEDSLVIYQNQGRPMNIRQITQALSRGAEFHPEPGELKDPYEAATVEGSVKPAYYELFKALKYTLPSPFVMRSLVQSGVWSEAKGAKRLKDIGWIPQDADEAAHAWATGTAAKANPYVGKAETQLWSTLHRSYIAGESDEATTVDVLDVLGLDEAAKSAVVGLWTNERELTRKQLTPAQIKKAWGKAVRNPLTGVPWTRDEALAALIARGYSTNDASVFLDE